MSAGTWQPFRLSDDDFGEEHSGVRIVNLRLGGRDGAGRDRVAGWLRWAMLALAVLAVAAAVVSYTAQYRLVYAAKRLVLAAVLEAGIPDAGAAVFAALGIALALHGRRALRCRVLNLACVGLSVLMNALGAGQGWRDLAVWVMPAAVYAVASDTLIGVVRAQAVARGRDGIGDEDPTPLAVFGGLALWLLRLAVAAPSTLAGFRRWVIAECPAAPRPRALTQAQGEAQAEAERLRASLEQVRAERDAAAADARGYRDSARQAMAAREAAIREVSRLRELAGQERETAQRPRPGPARRSAAGSPRPDTKTARFLERVAKRYGPLAGIAAGDTARIAGEVAPQVGLHPGSARTALAGAVRAAQDRSAA